MSDTITAPNLLGKFRRFAGETVNSSFIWGKGRRLCVTGALIIALAMPTGALIAAPAKGLGMWVWSESSFSTDEARQKLIRFCVTHQIRHLDVYINISTSKNEPIIQHAEALRDFILLAGAHNISIAALRGNPKMFFSQNHEQTFREMDALIAFYKTLPAGNLFKGIKYDVEPYRTEEWKAKGESRATVMLEYLAFLRKARGLLREEAPDLWLAADVPFWWDKDELVTEFEGKTKRFSEHVQDLTDFIVIMSYRRSVKNVVECVENERRYAKEINKVIFPSLETIKLVRDPHISFWESTSQQFWDFVPQLLEIVKPDTAIGGVMIHCYRSFVEKSGNENSAGHAR